MRIGTRIQDGWTELPRQPACRMPRLRHLAARAFAFDLPDAQEVRTLFTQMMLDRGILATGSFYAMWAHTDAHVDRYLEAVERGVPRAAHRGGPEGRETIAARPGRPFRVQATDLIRLTRAWIAKISRLYVALTSASVAAFG